MSNPGARDIEDRAFRFSCRMVALAKSLADCGPILRLLAVQALKSGTSIGANLEEARAAQSKPDFIAKCSIARKEAFEVRYWLRLLLASERGWENDAGPLAQEATELAAILTAIVRNARRSKERGSARWPV
jgi:four helix bundle protein